ncbi:MAG: nuclear transport factor 2 family protein [Sphingobacteriaceae bacterium]|nr:MAG: nuclear transport factor 2 family protein [Sphingobacteriaceae bacterium]
MKKSILLFVIAVSVISNAFAQKKENGTVYIEHPAIKVVEEFVKATVSGDEQKIASFLTEDFKAFNGTTKVYNDKGTTKAAFIKSTLRYPNEMDYFSIETMPGTYPDAVEYKKDNKNNEVWVQVWSLLKGVHKATGVKLDAAAHRLYKLTKDNKIKTIVTYTNGTILDEIGASFNNRTNGKIYNHHENINTVRKATYAFEKADLDKTLSYYTDDATFADVNTDFGKSATKTEIKAAWQKFLTDFEIKSIEMVGYPDYLEYEMADGREVLSWWKFNLVRKSDKKVIVLPVHISDSFDDKGKINAEMIYYSDALLAK